jgi:hypothetical protein
MGYTASSQPPLTNSGSSSDVLGDNRRGFRVGGAADEVGGDAGSAKETRGMTRLEGEFRLSLFRSLKSNIYISGPLL